MAETNSKQGARAIWLVWLVSVSALLAHLAVSVTYSNWFWGFNHCYFLGRKWTVVLVSTACLACLPWVWARLAAGYAWIKQFLQRFPARAPAVHLAVAGMMGVIFYLLRMPHHLLGDGRLLIRLLGRGQWFHPHEPLDRLVHFLILKATHPLSGADAETVYVMVSVGAGLMYVLAALHLGDHLRQKLFIMAYLVTLGTVQLFLGYAESYSLATSVMLVYIILALEYLAGKRSLAYPGAALLVGVNLHHALLFLVPSFVYLVWAKAGRPRRGMKSTILGTGFLAATVVAVLATSFRGETIGASMLLVPWTEDPIAQYTLLSWRHLVDFMNQQILISPLAWIVALSFGVVFWTSKRLRKSGKYRFLYLAGVFPLVFGLVLRPGLGGSRDWDLWSLASFPYAVVAAVWLAEYFGERKELRYVAYAVVIVGLIHTLPWVAVNTSADLSIHRFELMAGDNPLWTDRRIAAARSELAGSYMQNGMVAEAIVHFEEAVKQDPSKPRYLHDLGVAHAMLGNLRLGEAWIRRALDVDPTEGQAYADLGQILLLENRIDEAERNLLRAVELDSNLAPAYLNLGRLYEDRGDILRAVEAYDKAIKAKPYVAMYWHRLALALDKIPGREKEARAAWERIVELTEKDPSQAKLLEQALGRLGRP